MREVGLFSPDPKECEQLEAGQVGYALLNHKKLEDVKHLVGDTLFHKDTKRDSFEAYSK